MATYGLRKIAEENRYISEEAANFIQKNFYVDDGIVSVETVEQAKNIIRDTRTICLKGNLRLHKIASNSKEVLLSVPANEIAIQNLDLLKERLPSQRTLGMEWSMETDEFKFLNNLSPKPMTRRGILSTVGQIYDPMGFISPFTLLGKSILQGSCEAKLGWDDLIEGELKSKWISWLSQLPDLIHIKIPRCLKPDELGEVVRTELHHFSDASQRGYGSCSYIRFIDKENNVHCSLLMLKQE